ncbi:MAG: sensor histidine kinase [Fimbriimonas sp.]
MAERTLKPLNQILLEFEELRIRLEEAEQTLDAIRQGEVDALVVYGDKGEQVFTLKGAEQPYREFIEQIQEGAASLAADGLVLWANQRLAEMLDVPLGQIIGAPLRSRVADAATLDDLLEAARSGVSRGELLLLGQTGALPVLASVSALAEAGEAAFALTLTDLSVQKRHDQALAAERLTRAILEQATEAIVVCDAEGRVLRANSAAGRLGVLEEGAPLLNAMPLRFVAEGGFAAAFALAHSGATVRGLEASLETADGPRDLLVGVGALDVGEGGVVVTLTDITDRNAAFRFAQHMNETLERRVEERTEELLALNRELEGFCYSVSHDLRAPLRGMNSASQMIIQDYGDRIPDEAHGELKRITRNATRLAQLMDDLLAFSRLGRQEMRVQPIDLTVLGRSIAEDYANEGVAVQVDEGLVAEGDPSLLRLMLGNLIGNAVKFSRGRPDPMVVVGRGEEAGTFVVRDNGIGFKPEYAEKIFLPFERLHTEQEFPGTGIGLANVERIVRRHGGRVWAHGRPGAGADFYFRLPVSIPVKE